MQLIHGDTLTEMAKLPDKSVDLIVTDPPYGTTSLAWDKVLDFEAVWNQYRRIIKENGAIVIFGQEPFSSLMRVHNLQAYKYDLVWLKNKPTNFFQLKRRVGKDTENIMVFYDKQPTYNPQMRVHDGKRVTNATNKTHQSATAGKTNAKITPYKDNGLRYPSSVLSFAKVPNNQVLHPTQKPVELLEWLIKTYSNVGDVILDNTMGSGSTGVASVNTGRDFIGIELDDKYFKIAKERIDNAINTR
jgi:DNA modification methylase